MDNVNWNILPKPIPSAGEDLYKIELQKSLEYSKNRSENYKKYLKKINGDINVDFMPIKLDIENVSRCNFRCQMCVVSEWEKGKRANDMKLSDFKKILDEQYGVVEIKLTGLGEPSLQGQEFFDMIREARRRRIWVRTITNASLLHKGNKYKEYIDSGANEIQISIDGSDKKTFENVRIGGKFERICENVKLINDYSSEKNVTRTKMWTVVQKDNEHQLEKLVELAKILGFKHLVFSIDIHGWGISEWSENNKRLLSNNLTTERLLNLVEMGKTLGVRVGFWAVQEKYDYLNGNLCPWPFERLVISSDLRLVPCCMVGNPDVFEFGHNQNFKEIWFGEKYKSFRASHVNGDLKQICKSCYNN